MGTMIPNPAIYDCINATIICMTGNGYGVSMEAKEYLNMILNSMTLQKWELYLKDLSKNIDLLYQLGFVSETCGRWAEIINSRELYKMNFNDAWITEFLKKTYENKIFDMQTMASRKYDILHYEK
jgi:hypothetical protein